MVRGEDAAASAAATAAQTFAGGGLGDDLSVLTVPPEGIRLGAACTAIGFAASNGEAKRKIAEGAVRIDDEPVTDPGFLIELAAGEERKLSLGRKRHGVLRAA
jgi:tyrosyl-tRNA synthetase